MQTRTSQDHDKMPPTLLSDINVEELKNAHNVFYTKLWLFFSLPDVTYQ